MASNFTRDCKIVLSFLFLNDKKFALPMLFMQQHEHCSEEKVGGSL